MKNLPYSTDLFSSFEYRGLVSPRLVLLGIQDRFQCCKTCGARANDADGLIVVR